MFNPKNRKQRRYVLQLQFVQLYFEIDQKKFKNEKILV